MLFRYYIKILLIYSYTEKINQRFIFCPQSEFLEKKNSKNKSCSTQLTNNISVKVLLKQNANSIQVELNSVTGPSFHDGPNFVLSKFFNYIVKIRPPLVAP